MRNDATTKHLVELLKWATGPNRSGNPYTHDAVKNALTHLGELTGGNDSSTALEEAERLLSAAPDECEDRPPVFPSAVYAAYNAAKGCGGPGRPMRFSGREIDGMPYPDVCRTVRATLGDDEFERLMNDHGFMRWAASAPNS